MWCAVSDYTPTIAQVRGAWVEVNYLESSGNMPQTASGEEFDRWLAEYTAER